MKEGILFEEKQYLGSNPFSILRRSILAVFCFVAYYWSQNPLPVEVSGIRIGAYPVKEADNSGQLFFLMGLFILFLSALLVFVLHIKTTVTENSIVLDGIWTSRKVKIDMNTIASGKITKFKHRFFQRPVYNLHHKGIISFYTRGTDAVELTDRDGLIYRIGTQKPRELLKAVEDNLS